MAKDPAFLFYASDFLTGTMFMSFEQRGKYIYLMCAQHQHEGIIDKNSFNQIVGDDKMLRSKFEENENGFFNERLEIEILKRKKDADASRNNGKLGGRPSKHKHNLQVNNSKPKHNLIENENINEDKNEIWTEDILLDRDFKFSELAHSELSEVPDPEWIKSHLVKCNRDGWQFDSQHKFRKSLLGWLKSCIKNNSQKKSINSQPQFDPVKK